MKKFILRFILFLSIGLILGEITVRVFKLTSDIPQRYVDDNGIQLYKPNQIGFYKGMNQAWKVNDFGWLGVSDLKNKENKIAIIGDSYIENLMNPSTCNQGYLLQEKFKNYGFFEAGRSGVTFIEALEIARVSDTMNFNQQLIYVKTSDFEESLVHNGRFSDRVQIDMGKQEVLKGEIKSSRLKKVLYSTKFIYYLYRRFPLLVSKQNLGERKEQSASINRDDYSKLFDFCNENYNLSKITLIIHPNTSKVILDILKSKNIKFLELQKNTNDNWDLNNADGHWSCHGHKKVAEQVAKVLKE